MTTSPTPARDTALDALRGLAVFLMVAAGLMPWGPANVLPGWMYHAQEPPPTHEFNPNLPGITWVDLVFPTFLFAMGAAIPLAYSRRLDRGDSRRTIFAHTLSRGALLVWFAIFRNYVTPYKIDANPTAATQGYALAALALLFAMFTRVPDGWRGWREWALRAVGFGGGGALLWVLYHGTGRPFSLGDSDIILMILANMAVLGAGVWLCTRGSLTARLLAMGLAAGAHLASSSPGWVQDLYNVAQLPFWPHWTFGWFFQLAFAKYLVVVLPGTIVGDLLVAWRGSKAEQNAPGSSARWIAAALLCAATVVDLLAGLWSRHVLGATLIAAVLVLAALRLAARPATSTQRLVGDLLRWGGALLALGLVLEPFEGGIKKDPATLSYLLVTPALGCLLLSALLVLTAQCRRPRAVGLLADMGRNPMVGYVGMQQLVLPVLVLTGLDVRLSGWFASPWMAGLLGALETLVLAYVVRLCNRWRLYWRT